MTIHDFTYTGGDSGVPYQVQQHDRLDRAVTQTQYYFDSVQQWYRDARGYATTARQDRDHIQELGDTIVNTGQQIEEKVDTAVDAADTATTAASHAATDRQAAQDARTGAETAETNAGTHATNAASSASTAADILAASQALGITVDTSVGTRVFVGDIMVFGEIPPRILPVNGLIEGQLRISRDNNNVTIALVDAVFETSGNKSMPRLEAAYRPSGTLLVRSPWFTNDGRTGLATLTGGGYFNTLDVPANTTINLNFTFPATYSWPTTLPGTPA